MTPSTSLDEQESLLEAFMPAEPDESVRSQELTLGGGSEPGAETLDALCGQVLDFECDESHWQAERQRLGTLPEAVTLPR